jgi:hypothetical protein
MLNYRKIADLLLLLAGIILLAGCSGSSSNPAPAAAATPSTPLSGQTGTGTSDNITPVASQPQSPLPGRVDVIYFHMNQRCPTCLCFEQRVNSVIEANYGDAIKSGSLTYRVLNAQQQQNAAIVKKYGVVGSQLFINTVVNGEDHIEDIKDIWNWNCRGSAAGFDRNVRSVIDYSLKGKP